MEEIKKLEVRRLFSLSKECLETVKLLIRHKKFRDAVSKAYYSMFYAACALLRTEKLDTSKHSGVIALLNQHFFKTKKVNPMFYEKYVKAFEDRLSADYNALTEIAQEEALQKIEDASSFNLEVERYLKKRDWI